MLRRVDAGDGEAVAHRAVRGRAAPLAQDRRIDLVAREVDDLLDGEEIAREVELGDQRQLALQRLHDVIGHAVRVAVLRPLGGCVFEIFLRAPAIWPGFFGVFVAQLVEAEGAGIGHLARGGDRVRPAREQVTHRLGAAQMALGIGAQQVARARHGGLVADRGHHVVQGAAVGRGVMDVVGRQQRQPVGLRQRIEPVDPRDVVALIEVACGEVAQRRQAAGEMGNEIGKRGGELILSSGGRTRKRDDIVRCRDRKFGFQRVRRQQDQLHVHGMFRKHFQRDVALALLLPFTVERAHPPGRDQRGQPAIGLAVLRVGEEGKPLDRLDPAADDGPQLQRLRLRMDAHHARHAVGVGHPDRIVAQRARLQHQVDRVRRAAKEAEAGDEAQLDERRTFGRIDRGGIELDRALGGGEGLIGHLETPSSQRKLGSFATRSVGVEEDPSFRWDDVIGEDHHASSSSRSFTAARSASNSASCFACASPSSRSR